MLSHGRRRITAFRRIQRILREANGAHADNSRFHRPPRATAGQLTASLTRNDSAALLLTFDFQSDVDELVFLAADEFALAGPV